MAYLTGETPAHSLGRMLTERELRAAMREMDEDDSGEVRPPHAARPCTCTR
jgi:hypothetical protein